MMVTFCVHPLWGSDVTGVALADADNVDVGERYVVGDGVAEIPAEIVAVCEMVGESPGVVSIA